MAYPPPVLPPRRDRVVASRRAGGAAALPEALREALRAPARARVAVGGPEAPAWLRDSDHTALVLSRTRVRVGRAAPPQACSSAGSPSMLTALFSAE